MIGFALILLTIILAHVLKLYNNSKERKRLEAEKLEEIRLKKHTEAIMLINEIKTLNSEIGKLLSFNRGYCSNNEMQKWLNYAKSVHGTNKNKEYTNIGLSEEEEKTINDFNFSIKEINFENRRLQFNEEFIKREIIKYSNFFDNIENRKLDIQQRSAIITNEDNNLVIAGAGSGKTTTIVGKVNYILDRYRVKPDDVLLISFTKKSTEELSKRVKVDGVIAKTFHALGLYIVQSVEGVTPNIFDENQFEFYIRSFINELSNDEKYIKEFNEYFLSLLKPKESQFDYKSHGEYIQFLKDYNLKPIKKAPIPINGQITFARQKVKSLEECRIADFLFINNINYQYEEPYAYDTESNNFKKYKPDFTIRQDDKIVYIEHLGIDKQGNVPPFFKRPDDVLKSSAKHRYWNKIEWARRMHIMNDTLLIETKSYEMLDGTLFQNLSAALKSAGIRIEPKSDKEIFDALLENMSDDFDNFIILVKTFIVLLKSNKCTIEEISSKISTIDNKYLREKCTKFISIVEPIYIMYNNLLKNREEIDFSDMINKATEYINLGLFKKTYKYIIVDEFQDISIGRYNLLQSIKNRNDKCKLFAVGDDWQSIYRFSGSDISLFKHFEKYFGYTVKSRIETTYRFKDPLISLSSNFILKNENQSNKKLRSVSTSETTQYKIIYSEEDEFGDDTFALKNIIDCLYNKYGDDIFSMSVLLLGRYGFDFNRIKNEQKIFIIDKSGERILYYVDNKQICMKFLTVHKAKGLEADIVVIINCNSGKYGFPSGMADDFILSFLLSEADQFENGEERRVFYVAMTRAKKELYLVSDIKNKSKFIVEIEESIDENGKNKCPYCRKGDLQLKEGVKRDGNKYRFWFCSNFVYGCEYQKWD